MPATDHIEALADKVSAAMGAYVQNAFAQITARFNQLAAKVDTIALAPPPVAGKDGKDADPVDYEFIGNQIALTVNAKVAELPTPKDGANGKDADPAQLQLFVAQEVQKAVEAIPKPKDGTNGANGENGKDGKDADPEEVQALIALAVQTAVEAIPTPKDGTSGKDGTNGVDGASVDPEVIAKMVADAVAAIPKPKDGERGIDGKSVDADAVRAMIDEAVGALPKPRDGADGVSIPGVDGQDGEAGPPGRDALQIDPLDGIDETRSYPRGTYAKHNGGTIRATRTTDPVTSGLLAAGWDVVCDGVRAIGVEQGDDLRSFAFGFELTSGKVEAFTFAMPVLLDRGPYKSGTQYGKGDVVTFGGQMFIAQKDTEQEPLAVGTTDWRLSVKRGRDGKDGASVKGDKGDTGEPGKDLTQMLPSGQKY